ncbi:hypothetical protein CFRS1_v013309 [Colletotrichum fructicola]|nr:hypothetical protein CFRS1_v013309 [Colletotrichum fructicola]
MAEAIGLASSVIAITDVAFKAGSAYLKIIRLLDEMKQVPTELRLKADRVRFFEEFLFYAEDNLSKNPLPSSAWSPTLLQDQLSKCHTILSDVREMVDRTMAQVAQPTSIRRKIALTRAIIHKDDLKALDLKLDEALQLYQLAQEQYVLAMMTYSLVSKAQDPAKKVELLDTVNTNQVQKLNSASLSRKPQSVSYEPSIFGRFHLSFQANRSIHAVIQAPSWITSTVYSVLAQRATVGWQMNLRADEMVKRFDWELLELIEDDRPQAVFKYLDEHKMSPFVRDWKGRTLLNDAVRCGAVSATRALLDQGLNALEMPPREREHIPRMLFELGILSSCDVDDKGPLLIQLLGDNGLDDHLEDPDFLFQAAICGLPFISFRALIERCSFRYGSLPTRERLIHIRTVKFAWQAWNKKRGNMRYSILGITYGSLQQQWSLWITNENYDYAGEFWAMVENQNIKVPGSWVDDALDLTEWMRIREELGAWQQEAAPPLIWSEYRKPRPPI